jgi:hypothetical protein
MLELRSIALTAGNLPVVSRVRSVWESVNALFTFIIGFASLLAPDEH